MWSLYMLLGPIRTRAKRTTYMRRSGLDYLKDKHQKEIDLEEKRLILEERRIAVSERTVALEEKKFALKTEFYKNLYESQQEIIHDLINLVKELKNNTDKS